MSVFRIVYVRFNEKREPTVHTETRTASNFQAVEDLLIAEAMEGQYLVDVVEIRKQNLSELVRAALRGMQQ